MIDDGRRIEDGESPCVWACVCRHAAIYAHEASNPREIEFFQGERVKVLEYQDPEWWYGVLDSPGTSAGDKTVRERLPQLLYDTHTREVVEVVVVVVVAPLLSLEHDIIINNVDIIIRIHL